MRVVIDTNLLVSGLLTPSGNPARILALTLNGKLIPLYNADILAEYRMVLGRPKFSFHPSRIAALLDYLEFEGELATADPCQLPFTDEADRKFYEVAVSGQAVALITGNGAHFPAVPSVMAPAAFLGLWSVRQ